ncbi:MAG: hypothetical protein AAF721_00425 [Myxococcota bacterium]
MPVSPTTVRELKADLHAAIVAIVPRHEPSRARRWKRYDRRTPPKAAMRWYALRLETDGEADPGQGVWGSRGDTAANSVYTVRATLSLIVDYGDLPEEDLDEIASDDHFQLADRLNAVRQTNNGLRTLQALDWSIEGEAGDRVQVVHQYDLTFVQQRDG